MDSAIAAIRSLKIPLNALTRWTNAAAYVKRQPAPSSKQTIPDPTGFLALLPVPKTTLLGHTFTHAERAKCVLVRLAEPSISHTYANLVSRDPRARKRGYSR